MTWNTARVTGVLIVDDERNIRATLAMCLEGIGCAVTAVASGEAALAAVERAPFDLCFLDLKLGDADGMDVLPKLLAARPRLAVVVITAHARFETAVEAIKRGAIDYLPKPFDPAQIRHVVEQLAERQAIEQRVADLEAQLTGELPGIDLETASPKMRAALELATRAAGADAPILLRGENGTGKSVLARYIHGQSTRAARPFITVNCPTLSEDLLTSELFGHREGAFTGAVRDQAGRVESAEGGTLFLDEIGEISPALQAKLLRFVQDKEYERVGENRTRRADVRVIAASNRDLDADVAAGRFRQDLLFRLNVIEIVVPALRDRADDILPLAKRFLAFFARTANRATPELAPEALRALQGYDWPGNVRELRNVIERAVILYSAQRLGLEALPERIAAHDSPLPRLGGDYTLDQIEREHVERVLARAPTLDDAARILGIDASTLYRKRKKYET
ncbi:MAG TPA: sigma-54 dependent transcriptional regulator [Kofleriaceae bacterium]|nr:sigma-54 dependent transcriptional regulator [Kofleriaceae bacterium]